MIGNFCQFYCFDLVLCSVSYHTFFRSERIDTHSGNDQPNNCVLFVQWALGWTPKKDSILEQWTVLLLTCFLNSRDPKSNLVWVIMFYKQQTRGLVSYFTNFECCLLLLFNLNGFCHFSLRFLITSCLNYLEKLLLLHCNFLLLLNFLRETWLIA